METTGNIQNQINLKNKIVKIMWEHLFDELDEIHDIIKDGIKKEKVKKSVSNSKRKKA